MVVPFARGVLHQIAADTGGCSPATTTTSRLACFCLTIALSGVSLPFAPLKEKQTQATGLFNKITLGPNQKTESVVTKQQLL